MKKINSFFIAITDDTKYTLTNEKLCMVNEGSVRIINSGASAFAVGPGTNVFAEAFDSHAYASHKNAFAFAQYPGARAYALVEGSSVKAIGKDTIAYATCLGSLAYGDETGGSGIPYPVEKPTLLKKKKNESNL